MEEEKGNWYYWIERNLPMHERESTSYDTLVELAISSYDLSSTSRKHELKDRLHFFLMWWKEHKHFMNRYSNGLRLSKFMGIDHTSIIHYTGTTKKPGNRKKTANFKENTKCINDFLNS